MSEFISMTSSANFFKVVLFPLSSFVSKFHFKIITGSGLMTICVYKGLSRNPEIRKNRVWTLPYNCRHGQVRDSKFDTIISNKKLLNATKCHGYSFYPF